MNEIKINRNADGTYTITLDGKTYNIKDTNELHDFLESYDL